MAYSGIYVSVGRYEIELSYIPEGLKIGLLISLVSDYSSHWFKYKKVFYF